MRKLTNRDQAKVLEYIQADPEMNLFVFGDMELFGLDGNSVQIFVSDTPDGWDFLALRFLESFILYSTHTDYDVQKAADFLVEKNARVISGKSELLEKLLPLLSGKHGKKTYMARLNQVQFLAQPPAQFELRRLTADHAADIISLYCQIEEFRDNYIGREAKALEELRFSLSDGGRCWGAFRDGALTAVASSSAENSRSAMIVGVATLPQARNAGLASCLVAKLCAELLGEGKQFLCLFYNNPEAGKIYRKIGFREIGGYTMIQ